MNKCNFTVKESLYFWSNRIHCHLGVSFWIYPLVSHRYRQTFNSQVIQNTHFTQLAKDSNGK